MNAVHARTLMQGSDFDAFECRGLVHAELARVVCGSEYERCTRAVPECGGPSLSACLVGRALPRH